MELSFKYAFEHLVGISVPPLKIDILYNLSERVSRLTQTFFRKILRQNPSYSISLFPVFCKEKMREIYLNKVRAN